MARAVRFYREMLGMTEVEIPVTFRPAGLHVRWLQIGDEQIHLIPAPQPDNFSPRHVALHVDDAAKAREELRGKGVEIAETVLIPGADRFFVRDPDGNRIEIVQWKEAYAIIPVKS
jgi:catechol 2,3-dioxygenase-like lactoylglutathione lyase family enzyme